MLFTTIFYTINELGERLTFCGQDIEADTYEDAIAYIHANNLLHLYIDGFRGAPIGWKAPASIEPCEPQEHKPVEYRETTLESSFPQPRVCFRHTLALVFGFLRRSKTCKKTRQK